MNTIAILVAFFSIAIPLLIPFHSILISFLISLSRMWKSQEIKLPLTQEDKKQRYNFLVFGIPLGIIWGFCLCIPLIFDMFGWHRVWFFVLIQSGAALLFIPILITVMGFRGVSFLIKTSITEQKGISEGIFISVIGWQVILFFTGHHDVLIPGFNESLQDMKDFVASFK
ncbi:MAG: hypothetical protein ACREAR_05090 [Nitrosotalea sp.]